MRFCFQVASNESGWRAEVAAGSRYESAVDCMADAMCGKRADRSIDRDSLKQRIMVDQRAVCGSVLVDEVVAEEKMASFKARRGPARLVRKIRLMARRSRAWQTIRRCAAHSFKRISATIYV